MDSTPHHRQPELSFRLSAVEGCENWTGSFWFLYLLCLSPSLSFLLSLWLLLFLLFLSFLLRDIVISQLLSPALLGCLLLPPPPLPLSSFPRLLLLRLLAK